jgi:predicted hydrocarbon binding protein
VLPLAAKLRIGLPAMANIFNQFSDQVSNVHDDGDKYVYTLERCPMCWNRKADRPVCYVGQGLLQEALRWVSGGHEFKVDLATCIAKGDDMGRYYIFKDPID